MRYEVPPGLACHEQKCFIILIPGPNVIKPFTAVLYKSSEQACMHLAEISSLG
jgi:hypothetical protein